MPTTTSTSGVQAGKADLPAGDRAALHVTARRRRRVLKGAGVVVLVIVVMVLLSLYTRDAQDVRTCKTNLRFAVQALEKAGGVLPLVLPQPADQQRLMSHFRYTPLNASLLGTFNPVAVCHCAEPHQLFLHAEGRHVVLFDGAKYEIVWMSEPDFAGRSAAMGASAPPGVSAEPAQGRQTRTGPATRPQQTIR